MAKFSEIQKIIEQMAFPPDIKCIVCDDELPEFNRFSICARCVLQPNTLFCDVCGRVLDCAEALQKEEQQAKNQQSETQHTESQVQRANNCPAYVCPKCAANQPRFDAARAPFLYDGEVKNLIYKLKFGNARYLAPYLAEYMFDTLTAFLQTPSCQTNDNPSNAKENRPVPPDLITFVPMHVKKQKRRGYNQAELLAHCVGAKTNIPVLDILERTKEIKNVAKMTRKQRADAVKGSISVKDLSTQDKNILLIDDVLTTSITANECAKQLKIAGAASVYVLTFATSHT